MASILTLATCHAGDLKVTQLRVDYRTNPMGMDDVRPRLGWTMESSQRAQTQSAYEIIVGSTPESLENNRGDVWDSGKVATNQQNQIVYAGQPLTSWTECYWKVRVWDQDGNTSDWSEPATWTMGILKPEEWKGVWIAYPEQKAEPPSTWLRHEFAVKSGLKRATVVVCGLGQYEMSLNGKKISDDILTPGWTKYNKTCLYDMYDVTSSLQTGQNAVGIMLGNGMYNVKAGGRYAKFEGSFGHQKAIAQIRLEYLDGTTEFISTSGDWRANPGPITFSSIYGGEDYDARLYQPGWDQAGFDDHAWAPALVTTGPGGALKGTSCSGPPIRQYETFVPVKTTEINPGLTLYDFGQNAAQMPAITVNGPAGSTVKISPSELLGDDKDIDQQSTGTPISYTYTLAGSGDETWSPRFFYSGYRYLKIESSAAPGGGELPTIKGVRSHVVHSTSAAVGEFTTSNDLINRIYAMVRWAQLSNMVSILTDCPHREKLGWLEEDQLNGPSLRYDFAMNALFAKIMNDMADSQVDNGLIPNIAPEYPVFGGPFRDSAQWGSAFIQVAGQQDQFTGDTSLLERYYDPMARYVAYLVQNVHNGILDGGLGDWRELEGSPQGVTNNAILYQDALVMAQGAELLGKTEDATHYRDLANQLSAAYNKAYFDPQNRQYAGGNQTAAGIALDLNFVPEGSQRDVLANLVNSVQAKGNKTGEIGFPYLLRALAKGGRSDVIYAMINQTDKPGYGFLLKHGATSLPEDWDNQRNSQDHFMLGQIVEWFYHDLAGIQCDPDSVGFRKIIIKPAIVGDLNWVKASYDSISGKIVSEWKRDGQTVAMHVVIPTNTTATIFVPTGDAQRVLEGGAPALSSPDVKFLKTESGVASYLVGSGTYNFQSSLQARATLVSTSLGQDTSVFPPTAFINYFRPTPITGSLSQDTWGVPTVGPRDTKNGLEDASMKNWNYWDGKIIKGPDGRYHMFASRWAQATGHNNWPNSQAVSAVSDNLLGPYVDQGLLWPNDEGGKGHNVTALTMPDGSYAVIVSETRPGDVFVSKSLDGPWTRLGTIQIADNEYKSLGCASNMSVMVRPDGDFEIIPRSGAILISKTGILGPYTVQGPGVYSKVTGLTQDSLEDPVIWYSGGLYHIVVNSWSQRKAFHLISADGINDWKYEGLAYDPTRNFLRYTDGTVNHWNKMERPNVYIENGHVVAITLAALDVPKDEDKGNDNYGSKVVVIPFDGAAMDKDLVNAASAPSPELTVPTANSAGAQNIVSPQDAVQGVKLTVKGGPTTFTVSGDYGVDGTQESPANALDGNLGSKYYCHVQNGTKAPGVDTGLLITPKIGSSIVTGLQFFAANDMPERDPMTVTLEGSNDPQATTEGFKDFSLIYEGASGLDSDPERGNGGAQIVFPNATAYTTYRLLITKTRATTGATQYGEVILFGKPAH